MASAREIYNDFATIDSQTGALLVLKMTPLRIFKMQLIHASATESAWVVRDRLATVSRDFNCDVELGRDDTLMLRRLVASRA